MDTWPLAARILGILLLWLLSVAPGIFASANDTPPKRQTEFSDRNYQPSRQINTSAPVAITSRPAPHRESRIIQSKTEKVKWTNARGEEAEYRMYYEYDGTSVTFASVCSNHRKGSIDYRNCRKAARQWFGGKCNGGSTPGRMYCHARNAFRP